MCVDESSLSIIDPTPIRIDGSCYKNAKRVVAAIAPKARSCGTSKIRNPGMAQEFLAGSDLDISECAAVFGRRLRRDINCAAERFGILLGKIALGYSDRPDKSNRDRIECNGPAGTGWRTVVGRRQSQPTKCRAVKVRVKSANIDLPTFTGIRLT